MNERGRAMCDDMFLKDGAFEILKECVRSSTKTAEDFESLAVVITDDKCGDSPQFEELVGQAFAQKNRQT